jgi:hypothetical protein
MVGLTLRGQSRLAQLQLLLTQHFFPCAAKELLQCSELTPTGHSTSLGLTVSEPLFSRNTTNGSPWISVGASWPPLTT